MKEGERKKSRREVSSKGGTCASTRVGEGDKTKGSSREFSLQDYKIKGERRKESFILRKKKVPDFSFLGRRSFILYR